MAMFTMWLYLGSAIALGLASLAVAAWALFTDRSRGRRRCCKCWYDMQANPSLRCPECGHVVKIEKHLFRTRRRWRGVAAAGVLLMLGAFLAIQPKVQPHGYASLTPVTALLALDYFGDSQWAEEGLLYHMRFDLFHRPRLEHASAMWKWQWRVLGRRALDRLANEDVAWPRRATFHYWLVAARDFGGDPELREAASRALIEELSHDDPVVRANAAVLSPRLADVEGTLARARALMDDDDPGVQSAAVMGLRVIADVDEDALSLLLEALHHDGGRVRAAALQILRTLAPQRSSRLDVYQAILAMENDPDCDVREQFVATKSGWQSSSDAWETIEAMMQSEDVCFRRGGFLAAMLHESYPEKAFEPLLAGLLDEDSEVRRRAILAITRAWPDAAEVRRVRAAIEDRLEDDDQFVRSVARWALEGLEQ